MLYANHHYSECLRQQIPRGTLISGIIEQTKTRNNIYRVSLFYVTSDALQFAGSPFIVSLPLYLVAKVANYTMVYSKKGILLEIPGSSCEHEAGIALVKSLSLALYEDPAALQYASILDDISQ